MRIRGWKGRTAREYAALCGDQLYHQLDRLVALAIGTRLMSDDLLPFLGEIRVFAYNFVPDGWVRCDGERRSTKTEAALYAIIGDKFGPKDQPPNTFALPDLRGCVVIGAGQGVGLSS